MVPTTIALVSLAISLLTLGVVLWLTVVRGGQLSMATAATVTLAVTRREDADPPVATIFMRPLLYSSRPKGHSIEAMQIDLLHDGRPRRFLRWRSGEPGRLRAGGIWVGASGSAVHHEFAPADEDADVIFGPSDYLLTISAREIAGRGLILLGRLVLTVSPADAAALAEGRRVMFEQQADGRTYLARIEDVGSR